MKVSLEISRGTTINIGSYNTVKPTITVKVDDIDIDKIDNVQPIISELVENMWALELLSTAEEMEAIDEMSFTGYINKLRTRGEKIKEETEDLWKKLQEKE